MTGQRAWTPVLLLCGAAAGCVLPSFEKVDAEQSGANSESQVDAGPEITFSRPACGLSNRLERPCDACIREQCCELAEACGEGTECGDDLLEPITPAADFSTDFDDLLGCMQRLCDDECQVNWGCLENYEWPDIAGGIDVEIQVVDFAQVLDGPLPDISVKACRAIDPSCTSGLVAEGTTQEDGKVDLQDMPPDFDGFYSFEGGGYLTSVTQWSEPVHRLGSFRQYQLDQNAVDALAVITGVHESVDEPFDPELGHLIFRMQTCVPQRFHDNPEAPIAEAPGIAIRFVPDEGATQPFYTEETGGVSTTLETTTLDGTGGAFNLLARNTTVIAVDTLTDREVARGSIRIPAGGIGFMFLLPRSAR